MNTDPKLRVNMTLHAKVKRLAKKAGLTLKDMSNKVVKAGLEALS